MDAGAGKLGLGQPFGCVTDMAGGKERPQVGLWGWREAVHTRTPKRVEFPPVYNIPIFLLCFSLPHLLILFKVSFIQIRREAPKDDKKKVRSLLQKHSKSGPSEEFNFAGPHSQ